MARLLAKVLRTRLLQNTVNQNVTKELYTGIKEGELKGLLIKRIEFSLEPSNLNTTGALAQTIGVGVYAGDARAPTVYSGIDVSNVIYTYTWSYPAKSGAFGGWAETQFVWDAPPNFVVVSEKITTQLFTQNMQNNGIAVQVRVFGQNTVLTAGQMIQLKSEQY